MSGSLIAILTVVLFGFGRVQNAHALHFNMEYLSSISNPPTNCVGNASDITNVMAAAAMTWKLAIGENYEINIQYWWGPGTSQCIIVDQGGTPSRTIRAYIIFNNQAEYNMDPCPLGSLSNYTFTERSVDLGGGLMNYSRLYSAKWPVTNSVGQELEDPFKVALHELGHSLGFNSVNPNFQAGVIPITNFNGWGIEITAPTPFAGSVVPLQPNRSPHLAYINNVANVTSGSGYPSDRFMPSALDMIIEAQMAGWTNLNLGLNPILALSQPFIVQVAGHNVTKVTASWIQPIGNWQLQKCTNLQRNQWTGVRDSPFITGYGQYNVTTTVTINTYFRLKKV